MRRFALFFVPLALSLTLVAGCGDDGDDSASSTTPSAEETADDSTTTTDDSTTSTAEGGTTTASTEGSTETTTPADVPPFCATIREFRDTFGQTSSDNLDAMKESAEVFITVAGQAEEQAPEEIAEEARVMAGFIRGLGEAINGASTVKEAQDAALEVLTEEAGAATQVVTEWTTDNCPGTSAG